MIAIASLYSSVVSGAVRVDGDIEPLSVSGLCRELVVCCELVDLIVQVLGL